MRSKVLVVGARGMLAGDLVPRLRLSGAEVVLCDLNPAGCEWGELLSLDITDAPAVSALVQQERPEWIINCAAYTAVDKAESESERAFEVNAMGPANLAAAASPIGARLLHISTDYVFGGREGPPRDKVPYREDDRPYPSGVYGQSKRMGEELLRRTAGLHFVVVRTSWLHGKWGPNFVETMLRVGGERKQLRVVNDQVGSPTWTGWLADVIIKLAASKAQGFYHACSRGNISWYDFAKGIFEIAGMDVEVLPQTTEELARPAPRPAFSTLDTQKLESFLEQRCILWQEGVSAHLRELGIFTRS